MRGSSVRESHTGHHPVAVAELLLEPTDDEYVGALLDVDEDTDWNFDQVRELEELKVSVTDGAIEIATLCTHQEGLTYPEQIRRVVNSGNIGAIRVKYADAYDSTRSRKEDLDPKRIILLILKYSYSMGVLAEAMTLWALNNRKQLLENGS